MLDQLFSQYSICTWY